MDLLKKSWVYMIGVTIEGLLQTEGLLERGDVLGRESAILQGPRSNVNLGGYMHVRITEFF